MAEQPWAAEWAYFRALRDLLPEPFFQTSGFLWFCAAVLALYWLVPRRLNRLRVLILVVASLHFYAAWNAGLALLVLGTSVLDYLFGRSIEAAQRPTPRKLLLLASIAMNLGVLAYFKYRGFFLNELHDLLRVLGLPPAYDKLDLTQLIIPFGISFYTFEAISYAVDVYRRTIRAERSLLHFLLFILFFPHLVAGPIVRAGDFLRQARRLKRWNWLRVQVGLQLFLLGLFKKLAIADRMAVFADPVFENPLAFSSNTNWLALLAFSLRIYADFSGYSDMALGTAHLFGYRLTQNFNMPYLSLNPADFWRRWHISLSTWLRDYVFIPLGGSRCGEWTTARNLLIVMALGGLWHGANWTYMLWGLYHGSLLVLHRVCARLAQSTHVIVPTFLAPLWTAARILCTFGLMSFGWVFFRPEWELVCAMLGRLVPVQTGAGFPLHHRSLWWTAAALCTAMLLQQTGVVRRGWEATPPLLRGAALAALLAAAQMLAPNTNKMFIYFTF